jgi:hypothetical protein
MLCDIITSENMLLKATIRKLLIVIAKQKLAPKFVELLGFIYSEPRLKMYALSYNQVGMTDVGIGRKDRKQILKGTRTMKAKTRKRKALGFLMP